MRGFRISGDIIRMARRRVQWIEAVAAAALPRFVRRPDPDDSRTSLDHPVLRRLATCSVAHAIRAAQVGNSRSTLSTRSYRGAETELLDRAA